MPLAKEHSPGRAPLFPLGQVVTTPEALEVPEAAEQDLLELLSGRASGDCSYLHNFRCGKQPISRASCNLSDYSQFQ